MHPDLVRGSRGFQALLGAGRWRALQSLGTLRSYRPGAFLLRQGDPGGFVLAISSGRTKVVTTSARGGEVLLSLRGAGDLVGEMARSRGVRAATVQALERCTAQSVSDQQFQTFLNRHQAHGAFTDYVVDKLSQTVPYQERQAHCPKLSRLSRFLLEILSLADPTSPDHNVIPFSHEALASALGMVRSTLAEQIEVLRERGVLEPTGRVVVLDVDRLRECAEDTSGDRGHGRTVR